MSLEGPVVSENALHVRNRCLQRLRILSLQQIIAFLVETRVIVLAVDELREFVHQAVILVVRLLLCNVAALHL